MPARRTLDPYAVLGIARDATPLQVARAHRRLAKRHHPDLHEGAVEAADRMRNINEAWALLSNPLRRADYDRSHPSS
ncbi:MAG TPA: J domain-containing protein, partial [Candidatus Limnocylindria bacterium]